MTAPRPLPLAADLYGDIAPPTPTARWRELVPGLLVSALAALAAGYLSDHYGPPLTLMALLIGLALNFLGQDVRLQPGLAFASRTLLRIGIVLVGARVTLGQIADLGPVALGAVIVIVAGTMAVGVLAARTLGQGAAYGALAGGSVAICGASAALALATTLGERRAGQATLALVLVGISALSSLALILYPLAARQLGLNDIQAGFLLGGSIHDVAQAFGAGYAFSQTAGETAAIVKLTRVALLAPVLVAVAWFLPREGAKRAGVGLPWFVVGFFLLAAVNSTGIVPAAAAGWAASLTAGLLACAVTATGIRAPMAALLEGGPKPLLVIVIATAAAFVLALGGALLL